MLFRSCTIAVRFFRRGETWIGVWASAHSGYPAGLRRDRIGPRTTPRRRRIVGTALFELVLRDIRRRIELRHIWRIKDNERSRFTARHAHL
jgi:hypothetical protein